MNIDWKDIAERGGWTFVQAIAGVITAGGSAATLGSFDWVGTPRRRGLNRGVRFKGLMQSLGQTDPGEAELIEQVVDNAVAEILAAHHAALPVPAPLVAPVPAAPPFVGSGLPSSTWARTSLVPPSVAAPLDPATVSAQGR